MQQSSADYPTKRQTEKLITYSKCLTGSLASYSIKPVREQWPFMVKRPQDLPSDLSDENKATTDSPIK